jgi:hypothetical protein
MHQVKALQGGLMREMWKTWPEQAAVNRGHRFRGLGGVPPVVGNHTWAEEVDPLKRDPRPIEEEGEGEGEGEDVDAGNSRLSRRNALPETNPDAEAKTPIADNKDNTVPKSTPIKPGDVDDGDVHVIFLFIHFVIERSREAMIWSWIVATIGGDNDEFGVAQRNEARRILVEDAQAVQLENGALNVTVLKRKTMEPWRVQWALDQFGDTLKASQYRFCESSTCSILLSSFMSFVSSKSSAFSATISMVMLTFLTFLASQDGYAYSFYDEVKGLEWWHDESTDWPLLFDDNNFSNPDERPLWSQCTINWDVCFPEGMNSASDIFRHVSFRELKCGDCSTYRLFSIYDYIYIFL